MKKVRPPTNPARDTFKQLPRGAIHLQAFCRARRGELVYLGREYSRFRIAATPKGAEALVQEGFKIALTPEVREGRTVLVVS